MERENNIELEQIVQKLKKDLELYKEQLLNEVLKIIGIRENLTLEEANKMVGG